MRSLKLPSFRRDPDRPTIKQRAATLKAAAARLMRKPAPAAPATVPEVPEAVDWHNPPPSFMAFPAIEPGGFVRIERGLPLEVGRLLGIARDELARRMFHPVPGETEAERQRREADHRARLLISALTAAADPDSAEAEALAALNTTPAADAELIALGSTFDAATVREREAFSSVDDEAEVACDETEALARRIAALPARTVEGMRAKIRVAAFYGVCDPDLLAGADYPGEAAIRSLYRDTPGIVASTDPSDIRIVPELVGAAELTPSLSDQIIAGWRDWGACCGPDETDADRAAWERVAERRDALLDAADTLPPTLENLSAKALALAWLEYVQEWERGREREAYDITGGLAVDIDTAIVGRFRLVGHFRVA